MKTIDKILSVLGLVMAIVLCSIVIFFVDLCNKFDKQQQEISSLNSKIIQINHQIEEFIENDEYIIITECEPCTHNYERLMRVDEDLFKKLNKCYEDIHQIDKNVKCNLSTWRQWVQKDLRYLFAELQKLKQELQNDRQRNERPCR